MNGRIKPIKNDTDYDEALELMNELVSQDPAPNTEKADQISILATLMEEYEKNYFPLDIPSAVDAIKFRMDQLDLKPIDLVQYLGSADTDILIGKIIAWGRDKKLNDARAQLNKVTEELGEIAHEICRNRYHSDEMIDAVGDTLVTIIILADICKLDVRDCLQEAYNVINKRTGRTIDGTFVKDE